MLQRDYLMKMIEEMGQVLARLIGLREAGKYNDATILIQETMAGFFKFDGKHIEKLEAPELLPYLMDEHKLEDPQLTVLADLLKEQGNVMAAQGEEVKARTYWLKALKILQYLNDQQETIYDFERLSKIAELERLIDGE